MGKIAWYKRDPRAALTGMMELTLEERGAYNTILDLIYDREGDVPDDDRFIAGWCRCDVRVWKRIKARLVDLGKLYVEAGKLRNERADRGVDEALSRVASAADAGRASGRKRSSKSRDDKDLGRTAVPTPVATNKEVRSKKEKGDSPLDPPVQRTKGSRIPADWQLSDADRDYARKHGFTDARIDRMHEEFVNHWKSVPGQKGLKLDWSATWQNRVLQVLEWKGSGRSSGGNGGGRKSYHEHLEELFTDGPDVGVKALHRMSGSIEVLRPPRAFLDA